MKFCQGYIISTLWNDLIHLHILCVNFTNTGEIMRLTDMGWSQDCPNTSEITLMYMGEIAWDQGPTKHS